MLQVQNLDEKDPTRDIRAANISHQDQIGVGAVMGIINFETSALRFTQVSTPIQGGFSGATSATAIAELSVYCVKQLQLSKNMTDALLSSDLIEAKETLLLEGSRLSV